MQNRLPIVALLCGLAVLAGACSLQSTSGVPVTGGSTVPGTQQSSSGTAYAGAGYGASGPTQISAKDTQFGSILVDGSGRTLYVFTKDTPNMPTCTEACAKMWPPFVAASGNVTAGTGIAASQLGTVIRADGTKQVIYNGWPLYYYAKDASPGEINGQGVGGVWFVISAGGDPVNK